jgi:hypothetical protein
MSMSKIKNHPNGDPSKKRGEFSQTARHVVALASDAGHGFLASAIYPLSLWRTLRADEFEANELAAIKGLLANTVLLGQPKWRGAVAGDVPSAVAVAVSFMPVDTITVQVDIAMTALIRCAAEGDFAAAIVAANILRNLPGAMRLHRRIATSWFVSNLTTLRAMTGKGGSAAKPGVSPPALVAKAVKQRASKRAAPKVTKPRQAFLPNVVVPRRSQISLVSQLYGDREGSS